MLGKRTSFLLRTRSIDRRVSSLLLRKIACLAIPSGSSKSLIAMCTGVTCWCEFSCASSCALLSVSIVFCVNFEGSILEIQSYSKLSRASDGTSSS